jgi:hypothetical protein
MRTRASALLLVCLSALAVAGCGSDSTGGSASAGPNPNDKQAVAVDCIRGKDIPVTERGKNGLQVGDPATGPRIDFYLTNGQAEGKQFAGEAQGAEQIGAALLYVRQGSDELLEKLEDCLAD